MFNLYSLDGYCEQSFEEPENKEFSLVDLFWWLRKHSQ